ncbi:MULTISPECIES: Na(+)/H(+) antiporter subunit F1 [Metabacillus]|jgi:multicomponent Na+:H+ antiporter subunit F|uniref:Na(+)/H(+) antiporter subunit F1 n=1 Tax=Metabacillus rhizolycopersici TaxID=2875709 RepID=A0ABS7UWK9_9BACI|nr:MULTISPECIES: Na(+)/H(+) antiporter subunit F1 [Metabacillus]MBZ5752320.1 Na(+)/H(+) antiporter subunit F1 [Metabacillus rhizolycopersici]MCM3651413.1 Na(+)/H(+) antiporter subunit F1 [Metabacillus litoralis]
MLEIVIQIALLCCSLAMIGLIYRVIKGPTMPDRVIALDTIGVNLVAITALISIVLESHAFLEIILLIGILAFIGTVAFAKYLEKGVIIERERNR